MEGFQEQQVNKKEEAQDFFDNKIEVLTVSKDEFLEIMKIQDPEMAEDEILQAKGYNFDKDGITIILMRTDVFPEEYMPYLETHEKWEAYVARKDGYNLFKKSVREYREDHDISEFNDTSRNEFYGELSVYNYEFRHEYAIYKEYQAAQSDGKLDEYHNWILKLRENELPTASEQTKELIKNDTRIRESIFNKLTVGGKHLFTKNV